MSNVEKKTKNKSNNKATTGTGKNTAFLGVNNKTDSSNANSTKQIEKSNIKNNNYTLAELESKTTELKEKLQKINSEIETEKHLFIEETNQLNEDLTEKNFEISNLSSDNKKLISDLKEIKSNLDNKMKVGEIFMKKMEKLKKEEQILKKYLEVKDKEIKLAQKSQKIKIRDYNVIKNVSENNDEKKESELTLELEEINSKKDEIESENIGLRKIIKEHKLCPKIKSNLQTELNLFQNAYQFEIKKNNMINSNELNFEEKKEKIKEGIKKEKEDRNLANNRAISYGDKLRKVLFEDVKHKKSEENIITTRASNHISKICKTIGEQEMKLSGEIRNTNNSDYKVRQKTLFTESEQLKLATIIPPSYLNEFKLRFEALENERYQMADSLKKNQYKKSNELNSAAIKLNYTELKKKEQKLKLVGLNSRLIKKKTDIAQLKSEINKVTKEYNIWNKLLKRKNYENIKLSERVKELKYKNGNANSNNEIKGSNKRDINLEKQHNINFEYDMEQ